jgi:HD-like signal output (HDOD) protein
LAAFTLLRHEDLPADPRSALVAQLGCIPRPPMSLHKLLSPGFMDNANSAELSDIIMGEALIAAKVLAMVNSPFYGLRQPVVSLGQAMIFLGLNSVRSICLRYLMDESFQASSAALRQRYDEVTRASAIASELGNRLSLKLGLAAPGALVTQIVLSFLGQLATASLLHQQGQAGAVPAGLLERSRDEQDKLGLCASEIGGLLMHRWGLPASIADEVCAIDRLLVTPAAALASERSARLALCFLCARLGERLASGALTELSSFDPAAETGPDFFHLQGHLDTPALVRLVEALHSSELSQTVRTLLGQPRR